VFSSRQQAAVRVNSALFKRYGVIGLLWMGLFLKGTKTPGAFFVWSSFALGAMALRSDVIAETFSLRVYWRELLLAACLILSQVFSQDVATTFYYTTQGFILLLVWIWLKADVEMRPNEDDLIWHLIGMALLGIPIILGQFWCGYFQGHWSSVYGLLPINPVFNAAWIACIATMLVARLFERGRPISHSTMGWAAVFVFLGISLILPVRSSLLAFVVGLLYAGYRVLTFRRVTVALLAVAAILMIVPGRVIQNRLRLNEGNYRGKLWAVALRGISDHPLTGGGMGNFEMVYQRHAFPVETDPVRFARTTIFAHNELLQAAADAGVPVFLILCAGFLSLARVAVIENSERQRPAIGGIIVLVVLAFYNIIWHLPLLVCLTIVLCRLVLTSPLRIASPRVGTHRWGLRRALFVMVLFSGAISSGWCALRAFWTEHGRSDLIVHVNPADASAWKDLADREPDLDRALIYYARAASVVPGNLYFHEALGRALEASRRPDNEPRALTEYLQVLDLAPGRALDALAVGRVLFTGAEPVKACEWFKNALRIEPHYWECDLWIARCLVRMGKRRQAISILRHLQSRKALYEAWRMKAYEDLPRPNIPSGYDQAILAYDDTVVTRELVLLERHR